MSHIRNKFPDVTIIETGRNLGFAGGNNVGIRHALENGADYVWLLNNDTEVEPDVLSEMVRTSESAPSFGAIGAVLVEMNNRNRVQAYGGGRVNVWLGLQWDNKQAGRRLDYINGASLFIPRRVLEAQGLLDERFFMYWEDTEFGFRLRQAGWELGVAESARVYHKGSASFVRQKPVLSRYATVSAVRFLKRYSPIPPIAIMARLAARLLKRVYQRDWDSAKAIISATLTGQ